LLDLVSGTYSSVVTATPILTYLQQVSPLARSAGTKRQRLAADDSGAVI